MQSTLGSYQEVNIHDIKSLSIESDSIRNGKVFVKTIYAKTKEGITVEINFFADKESTLETKD